MNDDIPTEDRARIEAEYLAVMRPAERAMVAEWDQLEVLRAARSLSPEQAARWYHLTLRQDDI